jgi:hypothetical protein
MLKLGMRLITSLVSALSILLFFTASTAWTADASAPVSDTLACNATGSVGPNGLGGGREGYFFFGPAQGAGSCQSAEGAWTLSYTGSWGEIGPWGQPPPCPGTYNVTVTVTNQQTGVSQTEQQTWSPPSDQSSLCTPAANTEPRPIEVTSSVPPNLGSPLGAGTIQESPDPSTLPSTMTTATTWTFLLNT